MSDAELLLINKNYLMLLVSCLVAASGLNPLTQIPKLKKHFLISYNIIYHLKIISGGFSPLLNKLYKRELS